MLSISAWVSVSRCVGRPRARTSCFKSAAQCSTADWTPYSASSIRDFAGHRRRQNRLVCDSAPPPLIQSPTEGNEFAEVLQNAVVTSAELKEMHPARAIYVHVQNQ